jgi:phage terminase small subunit
MARTGRPPKIAEKRRREGGTKKQGAVSHRPLPDVVAVGGRPVDVSELKPPADLDDLGKQVWVELVGLLVQADLLDRIDLAAIRLAVVQYVQHELAYGAVSERLDDVDEFVERLDATAALLVAKRNRIAQAIVRDDPVSTSEIDSLLKAEVRLANAREAVRLRKAGVPVALGSTGQVVEHPMVQTGRAAAALFLRFAGEFGATPLARTRIALGKAAGRKIEADLEDALGKGRKRRAS